MDIYVIGICGTGVGALAGLLRQLGHRVRGSDQQVYPPMSDKLREWGIPVLEGFDPAHLAQRPELVIIGNVIRASNPEAVYVREQGLPYRSMPEAIAELGIGARHSIVFAGTHGKTTTTALAAHLLEEAGRDPSYLIGGAPIGAGESFRSGAGRFFVVEGDEYDTAYFDKRSKFIHYRARTAVITSLEYDHADIFGSIEAVERAFASLLETVPSDGHVVVWQGARRARRLIAEGDRGARVTTYATEPARDANLSLARQRSLPDGLHFEALRDGRSLGAMHVPLWGEHSAQNVLAVIGALHDAALSTEELRRGLTSFRGVRRRLELRGEPAGVAVVDDFAHHPTAVAATIAAARTRWPNRSLWAVFEPRSATSRRNLFHREYVEAFAGADQVIIGSHERLAEVPPAERFDPEGVAEALRGRGVSAQAISAAPAIAAHLARAARPGDVVLICSNGAFGGLHDALLRALAQRAPAAPGA